MIDQLYLDFNSRVFLIHIFFPCRLKMKFGNRSKIIEPYLIGTADSCKPRDNVLLIQLLLKQTIEKAKGLSYTDLFVISSLPLMRVIYSI